MGLLIFLLLGLTTPALAALKGFHYVDQKKTWTEAQSYCRDKFTDLATIENQDDWTTVREMVVNSSHAHAWLGLYADVGSWRWALDNTSLDPRDLGSWFQFNENNGGDVHCAYIWNGQLFDGPCGHAYRFVCYDEPSNSYIKNESLMSWQLAQSYCREQHTDLASIRNQQELNAIVSATDPEVAYWMGLSKEAWKWSDQSDSSFRQWETDRPQGYSQNCGAAGAYGWHDRSCGQSYPFICSVPPAQHTLVLRVRVETNGSVNMSDPLVQEALLKQMEKRLRAEGVTQPLSLSWRRQPNGQVFNMTEG